MPNPCYAYIGHLQKRGTFSPKHIMPHRDRFSTPTRFPSHMHNCHDKHMYFYIVLSDISLVEIESYSPAEPRFRQIHACQSIDASQA